MIKVRHILEEFAEEIIDVRPNDDAYGTPQMGAAYLVTHRPEHLSGIIERLLPYKYCCSSTDYLDSDTVMTKFEPMGDDFVDDLSDYLFE